VWDDRYARFTDNSVQSFGENGTRLHGQSEFLIEHFSGSPDVPELVTDPGTGKQYWHIIVKDPLNDFKQEVFIEIARGVTYGATVNGYPMNKSHPIVEPEWSNYYDLPGSASGSGINDLTLTGGAQAANGNQTRIFTADAGNGSADPRKVLVRQEFTDGDFKSVFLKDQHDKKPLIIQDIITAEFESKFTLDMRQLSYDTSDAMDIAGSMVNTMELTGLTAPTPDIALWDSTSPDDIDNMIMTGGMYRYNPGAPRAGYADGAGGDYTYAGGAYDHYATNWASYLDPATYSGTTIQVWNEDTQQFEDKHLQGVAVEDRIDIKGNGWVWQGWGADVWWIQKTDEVSTYQEGTSYANPWSYDQEGL